MSLCQNRGHRCEMIARSSRGLLTGREAATASLRLQKNQATDPQNYAEAQSSQRLAEQCLNRWKIWRQARCLSYVHEREKRVSTQSGAKVKPKSRRRRFLRPALACRFENRAILPRPGRQGSEIPRIARPRDFASRRSVLFFRLREGRSWSGTRLLVAALVIQSAR